MKIEQLSFENLNALKGKWRIDFTDPAICSDGLFAITGPTGAGKTTILDAICVALYHQTPRLGKLSAKTNELMTRHTSHCMAEVTFVAGSQRYRAYWGQRRAKNSATGKLQGPKAELVSLGEADSEHLQADGKILTDKLDGKLKRIEAITGLDFTRFTTSMMLAQGQFAAFLQAKSNDRATLLEELTGNAIYTELSIAAFERHKQEKQHIALLRQKMDAIHCLSEEERDALNASFATTQADSQALQQAGEATQALIRWRQDIQTLTKQISDITAQIAEDEQAIAAFKPYSEALQQHQKVQPLQHELQRLKALREKLDNSQRIVASLHEQREQRLAEQEQRTAQTTLAEQHAAQWQAQLSAQQQWIREQVVPKQQAIERLQDSLAGTQERLHAVQAPLTQKQAREKELADTLQQLRAQQAVIAQQIAQNTHGDALSNKWKDLQPQLMQWQQYQSQNTQLNADHHDLHQRLSNNQQQQEAHNAVLHQLASEQERLVVVKATFLNELDAELKTLDSSGPAASDVIASAEHMLATRRKNLVQLEHIQQQLDHSEKHLLQQQNRLTTITEHLQALQQLYQQRTESEQKEATATQQLAQNTAQIAALQSQRTTLEINLDITQYRHVVKEGEPCPLCGSSEHDTTVLAQETDEEQQLSAVREQLESLQKKQHQDTANHQHLLTERQRIDVAVAAAEVEVRTQRQQLIDMYNEWEQILATAIAAEVSLTERWHVMQLPRKHAALFDVASVEVSQLLPWSIQLSEAQSTRQQHLQTLRDEVAQLIEHRQASAHRIAEQLARHGTLMADEQALQVKLQQAELKGQNYNEQREALLQQQTTIHERQRLLQPQLDETSTVLSRDLADIGRELPPTTEVDELKSELEHLVTQWQRLQTDKREIAHRIDLHVQQQQQIIGDISELSRQVAALTDEVENTTNTLALGYQELANLFPFTDVNAFLSTLESRAALAHKHWQESHAQSEQLRTQVQSLQVEWQTHSNSVVFLQEEIDANSVNFQERIQELGLENEAAVVNALLAADVANRYAHEEERLATTLAEHTLSLTAKKQELATLTAEQKTDDDLVLLQTKQDDIQQRLQVAQQSLGKLQAQQEADDKNQALKAAEAEKIEKQLTEYRDWSLLNDMIGSADGAKFRNFAQGLTLEYLVRLANQRLQRLDGRYQLVRASELNQQSLSASQDNLQLKIIDTWQADVVRDTKTLSGGESFLVSLALALALSDLVSHKTSIDCLFLDEGFGTLDPEALDMALHTLESLNQDGKLIGVISHVDAMKERIANQIRVKKARGLGYSQLDKHFEVKQPLGYSVTK